MRWSSHCAQHLAQAQHVRHLAAGQHVHVERHARLKLGQLEHLLHEQDGIDGAALRLEHQAHVFRRLVAHVGEQRQLLRLQQLGDAGDERAPSAPDRDLGDHDLIGAAAGILRLQRARRRKLPRPVL